MSDTPETDTPETKTTIGVKDELVLQVLAALNPHCDDDDDLLAHAMLVSMVAEKVVGLENSEETRAQLQESADRITETLLSASG